MLAMAAAHIHAAPYSASTACVAGRVQTEHLAMAAAQGNAANFFQHPAPLGSNLYDRDRVRAIPPEGRQLGGQPPPTPNVTASADTSKAEKASVYGTITASIKSQHVCVIAKHGCSNRKQQSSA